jgi:predicted O-linked N-acetylglucosamine transferase (SPINDLY family)
LEKSFDRFIDTGALSDKDVALLARSLEIDIGVDLNGFTQGGRTNVFALRSAPIQVNYLGYPGTMGAGYIDYLVADSTLIPEGQQQHYTEKIAYLPDTYQVNDSKRLIAEKLFPKTECGLPEEGFIFCCFNNNFKFTPEIFDIWMRLLSRVEGSVLWLFEGNAAAAKNLRAEAQARGVTPERLVFAKRADLSEHLARHRLADLFLDTLPCNAHTTASDALWAGLPVLTCLGQTFAGRVAASLLNGVGLPELITRSLDEYEALALELATNPQKLLSLKQTLAANRSTRPLFDTALFTKHIESAYVSMWKRHRAGLAPEHIYVRPEINSVRGNM